MIFELFLGNHYRHIRITLPVPFPRWLREPALSRFAGTAGPL